MNKITVTIAGEKIDAEKFSDASRKKLGVAPIEPKKNQPRKTQNRQTKKRKSILDYTIDSIIDRLL